MSLRDDIHWLAGILEGEGCFIAKKYPHPSKPGPQRQVRISVEMCDRDIVERIKEITQTTSNVTKRPPRPNRKHRDRYTINLNGTRAIQWAQTIYPLMGERRKAAIREMLAMWSESNSMNWRRHYSLAWEGRA